MLEQIIEPTLLTQFKEALESDFTDSKKSLHIKYV